MRVNSSDKIVDRALQDLESYMDCCGSSLDFGMLRKAADRFHDYLEIESLVNRFYDGEREQRNINWPRPVARGTEQQAGG